MNVFRAPGLEDVFINNVIIKFRFGVSLNINEIARIFGTNDLPIRVSNQNPHCARKKITIEVRKKSNEWYTQIPKPLQFMTEELKNRGMFETMFQECLQEQRLEFMRECIEKGSNDYKIIEWREPWVPPCTAVFYKKGKCVISGIHTQEQGLYICWYLAKYINIRLGIPATVKEFQVLNIVCDTRTGYPIDLAKLSASQGSLAVFTELFPACIVHEPDNPKLVSLVYPNGEIVETGAKTTTQVIKRHKRIVELCRQFRLDANSSTAKSDRSRERLKEQKKRTSGAHLVNVNNILKNLFKSMNGEDEDDDEDEDDNRLEKNDSMIPNQIINTTTSTHTSPFIEQQQQQLHSSVEIIPDEDSNQMYLENQSNPKKRKTESSSIIDDEEEEVNEEENKERKTMKKKPRKNKKKKVTFQDE